MTEIDSTHLSQPYIHQWNVMKDYSVGDIVIKGDQMFVCNANGTFTDVDDSKEDIDLNNVRRVVDRYHENKDLPSYDEIMKVFYEARPEFLL